MFNIIIKDQLGRVVATINADRYLVAAQADSNFTKSFSSPDFVEQLGLLSFATEQVKLEIGQRTSPSTKEVSN